MIAFRRFIIRIVEVLLVIFVVLLTLISAFSGWAYGHLMGGAGVGFVMFLIWGFLGFLSAAVLAAFYFLLTEIAENTKRS